MARLSRRFFINRVGRKAHIETGVRDVRSGKSRKTPRLEHTRTSVNPIRVGDEYRALLRRSDVSTYGDVAALVGVSKPTICYFISLAQRLPTAFVDWLRSVDEPAVLRCFPERRLRPVTRLGSREDQYAALRRLGDEVPVELRGHLPRYLVEQSGRG